MGFCARGPPQRQEGIERNAGFCAIRFKMFPDHAQVETVEAGGHGGVRGEDVVGARGMQRLIEGQAVVRHKNANALDGQERGMPFVHVIDSGVSGSAL